MARVACLKDGPRVHVFVGFDPLRQALYDHHQRKGGDKDPMAVVRRAIEVHQILVGNSTKTTGGFIGVKLYPPMGPPLILLVKMRLFGTPPIRTHVAFALAKPPVARLDLGAGSFSAPRL